MAIGLRVTFGSMAHQAQGSMATALSRLADTHRQLTTGKRITHASDDPGGASQVIKLKNTLGDVGQYLRNGDQAKGMLNVADSMLDSLGGLVREARTLALQAASGTNDTPETRQSIAAQLERIKEQTIGIANTDTGGRYLFAGQKTDTKPFDPADPTNAYRGDAGRVRVEVNRGEYVAMNVPGDEVIGTLLSDLDTLRAHVLDGDTQAISTQGVQAMTDGLNRVLAVRGKVGAAIEQIDNTRSRLELAQQEFQVLVSNIEEVDLSEAFVALQSAQNAYEASLASTARTFQSSLMDYLR